MNDDRRAKFAARLGVPAGVLSAFPLIGMSGATSEGLHFTMPECNGRGEIIGILERLPRPCEKRGTDRPVIEGSRRGLTVPSNWSERSDPVLVCEGSSDCVAATAADLAAVGVSSAGANGDFLAELLAAAGVGAEREIFVLGDRDAAGREGASKLARELANRLNRVVRCSIAPESTKVDGNAGKDLRDWLTSPDHDTTDWPTRGRDLLLQLAIAATDFEPDPVAAAVIARRAEGAARVSESDARAAARGESGETSGTENAYRVWLDPARLAEEFLATRTLAFVKKSGFRYDGRRYEPLSDEAIEDDVRKHTERMAEIEYQSLLTKFEGQDETPPMPMVTRPVVTNALLAVRSRCRLPDDTLPGVWIGGVTGRATVLPVANGLLDLQTRTLFPHSRDWFSFAVLPVAFNPSAPRPERWLAVLKTLFENDADKVALLQEVFGACLDASLRWKHFTAFVGEGDNGKSVVIAVLQALLGNDAFSGTPLQQLVTNRFAVYTLFGKLANISGDESYFESADEGMLKNLTGEAQMQFEQKHKTPFVGPNTAKILFGCNTLPKFSDKSNATWNRLLILAFDYVVPPADKDPRLLAPSFWSNELPGILLWAMDGLDKFRAEGSVVACSSARAAVEKHREESNPARQFLLESTKAEADGKVLASELFKTYLKWCEEGGFKHPLTKTGFGREVASVHRNAVAKTGRSGSKTDRYWFGLRLVQSEIPL